MTRRVTVWLGGGLLALALATGATAQSATKKELVQKVLQLQQTEIENVARSVVERPAAQMMQEAGLAMQRQVPPDKREAMGKAIEAEVKKYVDEAYPLARERALRVAPSTIGAALEEKLTEDDLKQIVAWLESPVNKKYQQLGPEMRNAFIQKLLAEARPVVDPKVQALDGRIRVILGVPPATPPASAAAPARPAAPAAKASGK
ncbi:MAG: DUF2059 domain-containing protein [Caldimonas sp.]